MDRGGRVNSDQIRSAERALSFGTWLIVAGAMLYSILTVTPLAAAHTPDEWDWTAPILPLVVDAAVVIVVRLDAALARLGGRGGRWPVALRWMTGCMTLALNVADSALVGDMVGVAVHAVAPLLLIVTAETGLAYRRAIAAAVTALEDRHRAEQDAAEQRERERAEAVRREAREEREHAAALAREQREHEAALTREAAEREERRRREEREQQAARETAEREARERREREREQRERERERAEREAAEHHERERRQRAERERAALLALGPAVEKFPEDRARKVVLAAFNAGLPVRQTAELCGWSVGWVSARYAEHRGTDAGSTELAIVSR
jgi:DNA segregation ATPase FtsK/SpoIIIE-like protein